MAVEFNNLRNEKEEFTVGQILKDFAGKMADSYDERGCS